MCVSFGAKDDIDKAHYLRTKSTAFRPPSFPDRNVHLTDELQLTSPRGQRLTLYGLVPAQVGVTRPTVLQPRVLLSELCFILQFRNLLTHKLNVCA